jgi:hypothetical protein
MKMKIINLQPHAIIFPNGDRIEPSGSIARVAESLNPISHPLDAIGVPVVEQKLEHVFISDGEETYDFPDEEEDVFYAVSLYVAQALRRKDLLVPVGQFRDAQGRVVGCEGLAATKQGVS